VRRDVDDDLAESFEDPVIMRCRWCNGIHRYLLGSGIATSGSACCSSSFLEGLPLSVETLVVSIAELLEGLAAHQLSNDGEFVYRGRDV
jgi:hypothetical protein